MVAFFLKTLFYWFCIWFLVVALNHKDWIWFVSWNDSAWRLLRCTSSKDVKLRYYKLFSLEQCALCLFWCYIGWYIGLKTVFCRFLYPQNVIFASKILSASFFLAHGIFFRVNCFTWNTKKSKKFGGVFHMKHFMSHFWGTQGSKMSILRWNSDIFEIWERITVKDLKLSVLFDTIWSVCCSY